MKHLTFITVLLIAIPFFVVTFFLAEKDDVKPGINIKIDSDVTIRVKRLSTNKIETLSLEEYIMGVVAGEMPVSFSLEALKAQAVASRSYALTRIDKSKDYDVVDSTLNQVYLDNEYLKKTWKDKYNDNILKIHMAVSATKGEYIEYDGKVADALFFSTSNGFTENSEEIFSFEVPYLRSVDSPWDEKTSPVFNDQKTYTKEEFFSLLGLETTDKIEIKVNKESITGRTLDLTIDGKEMKGSEVATKLKLRSNDFTITQDGDTITIKTIGYGHGVGMSQYGALGMAEAGYTYEEILRHYYQGVTIGFL